MLLLPFGGGYLAKLATRILPEKPTEALENDAALDCPVDQLSAEHHVGTSAIVVNGVQRELARMAEMVLKNVDESFQAVLEGSPARLEQVEETEEYIDYLNQQISRYISHIIVFETNPQDSEQISAFFKISGNLETHRRPCGEHLRIHPAAGAKAHWVFQKAKAEIQSMRETSLEAIRSLGDMSRVDENALKTIEGFEQKIDDMTLDYRQNQMVRLREGACSDEACTLYSEMLTDFERIGDHILNIGQELAPKEAIPLKP